MELNNSQGSAAKEYAQAATEREPFLKRARKAAKLTIPSLLPESSHQGVDSLPVPNQSVGARGVNNLASKLILALMPPNSPFFQFQVDDYLLEEITQQEGMRADVEEALGKIERAVYGEITAKAMDVTVGEALKQLIVAGNVLLYLPPSGGIKYFRLDRYIVKRDPMGNVLKLIVQESISPLLLPDALKEKFADAQSEQSSLLKAKSVNVYTHVKLNDGGGWEVYQEVKGEKVPGSEGTYPKGKTPWIALRFTKIDDEDYGRGYVEEYYGDLHSADCLQKAVVEGSLAAARLLLFIDPNGMTEASDVAETENGGICSGRAEDVSILQLNKFADFNTAKATLDGLIQRLSYAFLLNSVVQRTGERVTAEEIRTVASELEDGLGGIYSILSQELQLPLVNRILHQMTKNNQIPQLPGEITPTITTGLEALGRGHDLQRLDMFLNGVLQSLGQEVVASRLNISDYLKRRGTALGIDMSGLIKSDEQIAQEQAQAQQSQMEEMTQQVSTQGGMDMAKEIVKAGANKPDE